MWVIMLLIEFWNNYSPYIISGIISIVVAVVTTLITYYTGKLGLRNSERIKIVAKLTQEKIEAIDVIRKEISVLKEYEDLKVTERDDEVFQLLGDEIECITPSSCFYCFKISELSFKLNDLCADYGHCLRDSNILYLMYVRNFFYNYSKKCQRAMLHDKEIRFLSAPLYKEFRRWHSSLDKGLIRSLNKPTFKYYTHSGIKYTILKKIYGFRFKRSFAYRYMDDSESVFNKVIKLKQERIMETFANINNQGMGGICRRVASA